MAGCTRWDCAAIANSSLRLMSRPAKKHGPRRTVGAFRNDRGDGPRGTPTVDGDRLYALGGNGDLSALEASTGKIVWTKNVLKEFGGSNITWGISESPLVMGNKVLVNAGGPGCFDCCAE